MLHQRGGGSGRPDEEGLHETNLEELGGKIKADGAWSDNPVADGLLVTGQNPHESLQKAKTGFKILYPEARIYSERN